MKFSIRDLFLVTAIVALAVGWLVDRRNLKEEAHGMAEHAAKMRYEARLAQEEAEDLRNALARIGVFPTSPKKQDLRPLLPGEDPFK
ncbi:MAG: hypothetical protein ACR2FY_00055 [Pirellulaceae bacterium]